MTNLRTVLARRSEAAAGEQAEVREAGPRSYRDPIARPIILANRLNERRYRRRHGA